MISSIFLRTASKKNAISELQILKTHTVDAIGIHFLLWVLEGRDVRNKQMVNCYTANFTIVSKVFLMMSAGIDRLSQILLQTGATALSKTNRYTFTEIFSPQLYVTWYKTSLRTICCSGKWVLAGCWWFLYSAL